MNEQNKQLDIIVHNTTIGLDLLTSLSPDRTRTVINVIYILGIVFMIVVFLVLLWINLYSRHCWCWHDTPLIHRFNRQWLLKHSISRHANNASSSRDSHRHGRSCHNNDI